jgi:carboxypeptidase PM20D1
MAQINSTRVQNHLSEAITYKTISNADESKVDWNEFKRFHEFLEREYPLIHKKLKREVISNASLLYTWQGKNSDLDGIALLSHQDVVPISDGTQNDWTHPAFDGYNDGKFIWGRGAVDMKNYLICVMDAVETLLEEGYEPNRTVYLCFGHNEEIVAGKNNGAQAIMQVLKSRGVRLESTLDEGGLIVPIKIKGIIDGNLAGVGVAEKGYADYKVSVNAKGGHSSQPPKHTAVGQIAEVVQDLENNQFKSKVPEIMIELLNTLSKKATLPARVAIRFLTTFKPLLTKIMSSNAGAATFVRTTTACTMLDGSPSANVLPQKASVTINFRQMPGVTLKDTEQHIRQVCKNKDIEIELLKGKEASKVSPTDTKTFEVLKQLATKMDSKNILVPYLVSGGTDSYHYEDICDNIYRFAPFKIDAKIMLTAHTTNERCPIDQLTNGVDFFMNYIKLMTE